MNLGALLIAGLVSGTAAPLFARLPILNMVNCIPCGWIWISGAMTVIIYRWLVDSSNPLTTMDGIIAGAYSGLVAFGVTTAIVLLVNQPFPYPDVPSEVPWLEGPISDDDVHGNMCKFVHLPSFEQHRRCYRHCTLWRFTFEKILSLSLRDIKIVYLIKGGQTNFSFRA
jgi:hypothetical protein